MQKEKQTKGNYKLQTAEKDKLKTELRIHFFFIYLKLTPLLFLPTQTHTSPDSQLLATHILGSIPH